jgi:hypothetical protein
MEDLNEIWREYRAEDHIGPGSVVIDLGCSEGYFSRWAASKGAMVEGYDARRGVAVGPYNGYCTIKGEGVCAYIATEEGDDVLMVTLDSILARHEHVDFLKCDIEGSEYLIFDCDLSKVAAFAIEFHVWTTPGNPKEGLAIRDQPMPKGSLDRLLTQLRRTHTVEIVGDPNAGGYLHGRLK